MKSPGVGAWRSKAPLNPAPPYLEIIFMLATAIVFLPMLSVTSPVTSMVWVRWVTSFALFAAARSPVTV